MLHQTSVANTGSVFLSAEAVSALSFFESDMADVSVSERLRRFCHLCQLIEAYCLFDDVYVDSADLGFLDGVVDVFAHPDVNLADHPYLNLPQNHGPTELDQRYGEKFVDSLIDDFISEFPADLSNHGQVFRAIKEHDRFLITALAADSSRDLLRSRILEIGLGKTFLKVCGDEVELPEGGTKDHLISAREFCDNRLWESHLGILFLPTFEDYLDQFAPESDELLSLDAGRLIRKAYAILLESLRCALDFEDELAVSERFVVPPVTSAVLAEVSKDKDHGFAALLEAVYMWRAKFEGFRELLHDFDRTRRERPKGYRRKLIKLRDQIDRSSAATAAKTEEPPAPLADPM